MDEISELDDEFIKEFQDYIRPLVQEEWLRHGLDAKLPPEPADFVAEDYNDVFVMMRRIKTLEKGIKAGKVKSMLEEAKRQQIEKGVDGGIVGEDVSELFEIWLLTLIAKDKARLSELGLLELEVKGDLTTAKLVEDEMEQMFGLLRFKMMRTHRGCIQFFQQRASVEIAGMNAAFFQRLGRVLNEPGIGFEHVKKSPIQRFLLVFWATPFEHSGMVVPPLCRLSDTVIAEIARVIINPDIPVVPDNVRKTRERLGLRRSCILEKVEIEKGHGKTRFIWTPI